MVARFQVMGRWFTCDDWKAALNEEKHGVSFQEAGEVFDDAWGIMREDLFHSQDEARYTYVGRSGKGRLLRVSFCYRDGATIRLISARGANRAEQRAYYQQRR